MMSLARNYIKWMQVWPSELVRRAKCEGCSGKFSLVGTLTWHYVVTYPIVTRGKGWYLNEWSFIKGKNPYSKMGV